MPAAAVTEHQQSGGFVSLCAAAPLPDAVPPPPSRWRAALHDRLRERPYPLFSFAEGTIPAATVWTGARLWTQAFREAGLSAGDRVVLALPPSAAFVQALVAALWDGLTIAPAAPGSDSAALAETLDARAVIVPGWTDDAPEPGAGVWRAGWCEGPEPGELRAARLGPTPDARFLLRTSGTASGAGRWVALSDAGVWSNLDGHLPLLGLTEADTRVLSVLPWHHVFGLILDLLPALLTGCEIVRDPDGGRDSAALLALAAQTAPTHLNCVPLTLRRLLAQGEAGASLLRSLAGGIVGGAPVDAQLASFLSTTRLRVGYGQTEASPGVTLGDPGEWPGANFLGRPLGCETLIDAGRGELRFRGPNACLGCWRPGAGLEPAPVDEWTPTGDLVEASPHGALFFRGRTDDAFKLANGRMVEAGALETAVRSRFPGVVDALLLSRDGERLELFVSGPAAPPVAEAREALGAAGRLLAAVHAVPADAFRHTPKGALDRAATQVRLLDPETTR